MEITLNQEKNIVVVAQQTVLSNKVTRGVVIDDASHKIVMVFYSVGRSPLSKLVLWKDAEYDEIGDWNYAKVDARIKELLEKTQ